MIMVAPFHIFTLTQSIYYLYAYVYNIYTYSVYMYVCAYIYEFINAHNEKRPPVSKEEIMYLYISYLFYLK